MKESRNPKNKPRRRSHVRSPRTDQDEREGETEQQQRECDNAAENRSDVCDKRGECDRWTQSREQEVCEEQQSERRARRGEEKRGYSDSSTRR